MSAISTDQVAASGDKSELDTQILDIFQKILNDTNPTTQSADDRANEINELFQTHQKNGTDAEDFLWKFWTLFIEVAKKVPATDARQGQLVKTIEKLKSKKSDTVEIWGQQATMWDDLALFGPCMREAWNSEFLHHQVILSILYSLCVQLMSSLMVRNRTMPVSKNGSRSTLSLRVFSATIYKRGSTLVSGN